MTRQRVKLKDISSLITKGTTPTTFGKKFTLEGINFIKAEALNGDSSLSTESFSRIDIETHDLLLRSQLKEGDVLVTIAGANIGKCGIVGPQHVPANTNQAVALIRLLAELACSRYIYYYFKNPATFEYIQGLNAQAAQPNINLTILGSIEIELPEIQEQIEVAKVLTDYDSLIETNRSRIALLEESARLVYREWFVNLRYPNYSTSRDASELPEGWKIKPLSKMAVINRASLGSNSEIVDIQYVDIASVETGIVLGTSIMPYSEAPGRARRLVQHGDVIWSCVRPNRRSYALLWEPDDNVVVSTGFAVLTPRSVPFSYLYFATTSDDFVSYLTNRATGAAYPAVTGKDFEEAPLLCPDSQVLNDFHERCLPMLELRSKLIQQNTCLTEARNELLPKLMSGAIQV